MISLRKSGERGHANHGWLDSKFSFSFGDYYDPEHMSFGALRVINEDVIAGGGGFPPHSHRDMEIVTYILSGALEHKDSLGTGAIIRPGEIQRMSAGTGITHSEFNASKTEGVHLLQIWIIPSKTGLEPSYEQKKIDEKALANHFVRLAGPEPLENEVRIVQDAEIFAARLDENVETIHALGAGRRAWLQVAKGQVMIGDIILSQGDAARITDQKDIAVLAKKPSELLLFDLA